MARGGKSRQAGRPRGTLRKEQRSETKEALPVGDAGLGGPTARDAGLGGPTAVLLCSFLRLGIVSTTRFPATSCKTTTLCKNHEGKRPPVQVTTKCHSNPSEKDRDGRSR